MEVESEDDDDERDERGNGHHPSQPDQDTQLQDMDEVCQQKDIIRHYYYYYVGLRMRGMDHSKKKKNM